MVGWIAENGVSGETTLERSMRMLDLTLEPKENTRGELAAEMHQYPLGHQFGEWTVTGRSYVVRLRMSDGTLRAHPTTPVECSCGVTRGVRTFYLKGGRTKSCGHTNSDYAKVVNLASWSVRNNA